MKQLDTQTPISFKTGKTFPDATSEILNQAAKERKYTSLEWATLKQWNSANEVIRKGESGIKITFVNKKGDEVTTWFFNRVQLDS